MFEELESEFENFSANRFEQILPIVDFEHLIQLPLTKIRSKDRPQFESSKYKLYAKYNLNIKYIYKLYYALNTRISTDVGLEPLMDVPVISLFVHSSNSCVFSSFQRRFHVENMAHLKLNA